MDSHTGQKGDNDPIDVCEIGYKVCLLSYSLSLIFKDTALVTPKFVCCWYIYICVCLFMNKRSLNCLQ